MRNALRVFVAVAGVVVLGTLACVDPSPSPALDVQVAGCAAMRAGPVCEMGPERRLTLVVQAPAGARVTALAGSARVELGPDRAGERAAAIDVAPAARTIVVTAERGGSLAIERIDLAERRSVPDIDRAAELRRGGRRDEALAILTPLAEDPDPFTRAQARRLRGRIAHDMGSLPAARRDLGDAIAIERSLGRTSDEAEDRMALASFSLFGGRRADHAAEALDGVADLALWRAEDAARAPYFAGLVAREAFDLRGALALFGEAAGRSRRAGLRGDESRALSARADTLLDLGRYTDAVASSDAAIAALPPEASPCELAARLADRGGILLRSPRHERPPGEDPFTDTALALSLQEEASCGDAARASTLTNLALSALDGGAPEDALRFLEEARAAHPDAEARVRVHWTRAHIAAALARGDAAPALAEADALLAAAHAGALAPLSVEADLVRAAAFEALGRDEDAYVAYHDAEEVLERAIDRVPLGEGRDGFAERHARVAAAHVAFLFRRAAQHRGTDAAGFLRGGHVVTAAAAAVRSVGRTLGASRAAEDVAALDGSARRAWEKTLSEYMESRTALDQLAARDLLLSPDELAAAIADREHAFEVVRERLEEALTTLREGSRPSPPRAEDDVSAAPHTFASLRIVRPLIHATVTDPDEALFVLHPIDDGWAGFWVTTPDDSYAVRLGDLDAGRAPERLASDPEAAAAFARAVLEPFASQIGTTKRIRIVAHGPLDRVPFHALPWKGGRLLDVAALSYGLGLDPSSDRATFSYRIRGPGSDPEAAAAGPAPVPEAVVVDDGALDLAGAAREGAMVAAALERRGLRVRRFSGRAALGPGVRAALEAPDVAVFHYAGRALSHGRDGWESSLPLADGSTLTAADVLALRRVPPFVVLSACSGARTSDEARAAGFGLAHAFVVAGARAVVASTEPLGDGDPLPIMEALYERSVHGPPAGWVDVFGAAVRAASRSRSPAVWVPFRVLVR